MVDAALSRALASHAGAGSRVAVALSGGMDSMVLLDALARAADAHDIVVSALHVDHGISPHSGEWADFCAAQCTQRAVTLDLHRLRLSAVTRNLEATARAERYACLRRSNVDIVALAHHADDQAETLLLQALRGAGARGLAGMAPFQPGKPAWLRPLLALPRAAVLAYARARALDWVEDASNEDHRHRRNRLRHDVMPRIAAGFPGYAMTLSRVAALQAEGAALHDALAEIDAAGALNDESASLDCSRLASLPPARAANLLRWFLRRMGLRSPSQARLQAMLFQLTRPRDDARIALRHEGAEIGVHRGRMMVHALPQPAYARTWSGEPEIELPSGELRFVPDVGRGLSARAIAQSPVTLRSRVGGERLRLGAGRPTRPLRKLFQEARVPHWARDGLPRLWCGEQLVAIPGIGIAPEFQAAAGDPAWELEWRPRFAPRTEFALAD